MNNKKHQQKDIEFIKEELIKRYSEYDEECRFPQLALILKQIRLLQEEYKKFHLDIQLKGFENWNIDNVHGLVTLKKEVERNDLFNKTPEHLKHLFIEKEQEEEIEKLKKELIDAYKNFNSLICFPGTLRKIQFFLEQYEKFPLHIQMKGFCNWDISNNEELIALKIKVEKLYLLEIIPEQKNLSESKKRI